MKKGHESGTSSAAYPTWDIRSNTCELTMSFTHIFSSLST